jgi:rifampicin phosphotransferase
MNKPLLLKWFKDLSKESVGEAGGKGASLGEMTNAGIPVPNGYVILASSFEKFLEETDLNVEIDSILEKVNHKEMQSIENASEEIKALIMNAKMPKDIEKEIVASFKELNSVFVAVRSSATSEDSSSAAWAGQLDSFLNTKSNTLLENVKRCWASLFTPRAIFYRFEKGLHDTKISVAVVVQKMVNSQISGIAFSVHPVTQDRNQLIIEAGLGLGEAIVSGQITPDSYVIEKNPKKIIDKNISEQERGLFKVETGGSEWRENLSRGKEQKLTDKQIMELAEIILGIEKHYGFPCDIEWAFENGKFFIVQSRPITTLTDKSNDKEMPSVVEAKKVKEKISEKKVFEKYSIDWAKNYLESNEFDIKEARFSIPVGEILFTVYSKPNCFGDDYDPIFIPYSNQKGKQILPLEKYKNLERHSWIEAIKNRKKFMKVLREATKIQKKINSISIPQSKLYKLNQKKLHSYYKSLVKLTCKWWKYGSIAEDKGLVVEEKLIPLIVKNHAVSKEVALDYVSDMTMPLELSIFSKERIYFLDLCMKVKKNPKLIEKRDKKFFKELNNYSKKYFYARTSFYEAVTLNEGTLVNLIKENIEKNSFESLKSEFTKLSSGVKHLKEKQKNFKKLFIPTKEEKDYLWYFTIMHSWQDERKVSMMTHFNYLAELLREVSNRTKVDYDTIALMTLKEVEDLILGKKIDLNEVASRKNGLFFIYTKEKVLRFYKEEAKELFKSIPSAVKSTEIIKGAVACKGNGKRIIGKVRIVHNPAKDIFNDGEILVTTMTRPEFVPIMQKALAIVTDEGGLTSHAAIVSRELGTPCVIGTKVATQVLKDGDLVEVDANKGIVKKLNSFSN